MTIGHYVNEAAVIRLIKHKNGCCVSCHEDEEDGYELSDLDLGKGRYSFVCCIIKIAFKEWVTKQQSEGV